MERDQLNQLFESFSEKNILIIGDVMVDAYLWGRVDRISPEAPVPIVACDKRESRLGGAANVALNIKSLGGNPYLCSVIGNDATGTLFLDLIKEKNEMSDAGIVVCKKRRTTVKTRIISNNQQLLRVDDEVLDQLDLDQESRFIKHVEKLVDQKRIDAIIFEDYDKGVITPKVIKEVVALANVKGIPTLVDPKKRNFLDYKGVTFFKPNFGEFTMGTNGTIKKGDIPSLTQAAQQFQENQNIDILMITLSEAGLFIIGEEPHHFATKVRDVADVSGAGDTVISVAALCLSSNVPVSYLAQIANLAAGLVCEKVGVVPVEKEALYHSCLKEFNL